MSNSVQAPIRIVILGGGFAGVYAAKYLSSPPRAAVAAPVELRAS